MGSQGRVTESLNVAVTACRTERLSLVEAVSAFEGAYIDEAMTKTMTRGGYRNISAAARRLGIHRNTLYLKLQRNRP